MQHQSSPWTISFPCSIEDFHTYRAWHGPTQDWTWSTSPGSSTSFRRDSNPVRQEEACDCPKCITCLAIETTPSFHRIGSFVHGSRLAISNRGCHLGEETKDQGETLLLATTRIEETEDQCQSETSVETTSDEASRCSPAIWLSVVTSSSSKREKEISRFFPPCLTWCVIVFVGNEGKENSLLLITRIKVHRPTLDHRWENRTRTSCFLGLFLSFSACYRSFLTN